MTLAPSTCRFLVAALLASAAATLQAQVPEGWYVTSHFNSPNAPGIGGLYLIHPSSPTTFVQITGLGADLTGAGTPRSGANCVLRRPSDGALIVGEIAPAGVSVDLHVVTLSGSAVASDRLIHLGTPSSAGPVPWGEVTQCVLLPNDDVLVAVLWIAPARSVVTLSAS